MVSSIAVGHFHPHNIITVDPDRDYIFWFAIVRIIGLIHDGWNDLAMATPAAGIAGRQRVFLVGVGAETSVIIRNTSCSG